MPARPLPDKPTVFTRSHPSDFTQPKSLGVSCSGRAAKTRDENMRFLRTLAVCLVATLPLPAAFAQTIDYKRLDARISRLSAEEEIVGLAVAVIDKGEISFANGYGVAERGGLPVTNETVFRWAS
ncbi:MAG TPA: hypothetical protein DCG58_18825, partial [Hyphomonas adhaerens]|nr:hypothetical protein [Hyphomonas adhaerens]